ncbi:hypothetical protein [Actinopolymorpha pittospori]|uniref:Uncharacterized protein n=1 Tax=Actinopolymorpha pittospori TaxID=648752 RepID=A0A927MU73_9ACTN|nr:hypothetical protein [Actinopolymorpha pittospori]MBE1606269.1 hypothetical protein [Actinopolymorpha pittospori]
MATWWELTIPAAGGLLAGWGGSWLQMRAQLKALKVQNLHALRERREERAWQDSQHERDDWQRRREQRHAAYQAFAVSAREVTAAIWEAHELKRKFEPPNKSDPLDPKVTAAVDRCNRLRIELMDTWIAVRLIGPREVREAAAQWYTVLQFDPIIPHPANYPTYEQGENAFVTAAGEDLRSDWAGRTM